jgi:hypothetical protein
MIQPQIKIIQITQIIQIIQIIQTIQTIQIIQKTIIKLLIMINSLQLFNKIKQFTFHFL